LTDNLDIIVFYMLNSNKRMKRVIGNVTIYESFRDLFTEKGLFGYQTIEEVISYYEEKRTQQPSERIVFLDLKKKEKINE